MKDDKVMAGDKETPQHQLPDAAGSNPYGDRKVDDDSDSNQTSIEHDESKQIQRERDREQPETDVLQSNDKALKVRQKSKPAQPKSLAEFVLGAYRNKKVNINNKLYKSLVENCTLNDQQRTEIVELALQNDQELATSRKLAQAALQSLTYAKASSTGKLPVNRTVLSHRIIEAVRDVMSAHQWFSAASKDRIFFLTSQDAGYRLKQAIAEIRRVRDYQQAKVRSERHDKKANGKKGSSKQITKTADNAIVCVVAWYYLSGNAPIKEAMDVLREIFYATSLRDERLEVELLGFCISEQQGNGMAALMEWFYNLLSRQRSQAAGLQQEVERRDTQLSALRVEHTTLSSRFAEKEARVSELEKQLQELQEKVRTDRIHLRDDLAQQRAHTLRLLEDRVLLMISESLTALRREPPKVDVAKTYMQNVFDKLSEEVKWLKS